MRRHLTPRSLERAQWFADLNTALAEAEKLLALLVRDGNFRAETARLRQRIEVLRTEVAQLNRVILGEGRIVGPAWPTRITDQIGTASMVHPDWLPRRD